MNLDQLIEQLEKEYNKYPNNPTFNSNIKTISKGLTTLDQVSQTAWDHLDDNKKLIFTIQLAQGLGILMELFEKWVDINTIPSDTPNYKDLESIAKQLVKWKKIMQRIQHETD